MICVSHMLWQRTSSGKLAFIGGVCLRGVRWESVFFVCSGPVPAEASRWIQLCLGQVKWKEATGI